MKTFKVPSEEEIFLGQQEKIEEENYFLDSVGNIQSFRDALSDEEQEFLDRLPSIEPRKPKTWLKRLEEFKKQISSGDYPEAHTTLWALMDIAEA